MTILSDLGIVSMCAILCLFASTSMGQTKDNCRSAELRKTANEIVVLREKALAGDGNASWTLFLHYDLGLSDRKEGKIWLNLAAKQRNKNAEQTIKELRKIGLRRSSKRSADLELPATEVTVLRQKARAGDGNAAWTLFLHYGLGIGDKPEAERWLKLAAEFGNQDAKQYIKLGE